MIQMFTPLIPMFMFRYLTRLVGSPGPRPGAAGSDVRTPGALEGAQPPWVVQGAVPWDTCGTCTICYSVLHVDTWDPGTEGGDLAWSSRHMLRAPGLVSPGPVLLENGEGSVTNIQ